jgi:hypothetical protein
MLFENADVQPHAMSVAEGRKPPIDKSETVQARSLPSLVRRETIDKLNRRRLRVCHHAFRNSGLADFDRRTLLNRGFSIFSRTDKASSGETAAGNALRYGSRSSAARTRRHREKRRQGTRCVTVDINQIECDALVVRGYLSEEERDNGGAIKKAIEGVISHMVFELQSETAERSRARV